jgi:molybdate transport system substrate-binding protein
MLEIAKVIEKKYDCKIAIVQGGSRDLFESIKIAQTGDLFLPGDSDYIEQYHNEGYFEYERQIGYNQLAIFVSKGNPHHIKSLEDFLRRDLLLTIGNPETCSIGRATEETLMRYGGKAFLTKVKYNISNYAADSRDMNRMFVSKEIEAGLNWMATSYFPENENSIEIIPIFDLYAPPKKLVLAILKFSKHPRIAKAFVEYIVSPAGKIIMSKYGFAHE